MRNKIFYPVTFVLLCVLLNGCTEKKTLSEDTLTKLNKELGKSIVSGFDAGLSDSSSNFCIQDSGFLFAKNSCLQYYNLDSDEAFVLCSDVKCKHDDVNCAAWYDYSKEIYGAALYEGQVFYFQNNEAKNTIDLTREDISGTSKKIIYSFDKGELGVDDILLNRISDVYYTNEKVWFLASYDYVINEKESFYVNVDIPQVISLENNELVQLQPMPAKEDVLAYSITYKFDCISDKKLVYFSEQYKTSKVLEDAFNAQYQNGQFEGKTYNSNYPYEEYWLDRQENEYEKENAYYLYDMSSKQTTLIDSTEAITIRADDGSVLGWMGGIEFYDLYNGQQFLCVRRSDEFVNRKNYTNLKSDWYLWNPDTNTEENLNLEAIGGIPGSESFQDGGVIDGSCFRYVVYSEDGEKLEMYYYDLESGTSEKMFDDDKSITFRIVGATDDYFIGKIYNKSSLTSTFTLYKIKKEDYYGGKLDSKVKLIY